MSNFLITGANGFIGKVLIKRLSQDGHLVSALVRKKIEVPYSNETFLIPSINAKTNWAELLKDRDVVIHLLARVHIMDDKASDPLMEFRKINVDVTIALAKEAARQGIKRFVFLSSVKVNGESTSDHPFSETNLVYPQDAYAISKWEAEEALRQISKETGMEIVIIRSPLVYGPNVKANFLKMMQYVKQGIPLPLGSIQNKRSLIGIDNLVDFITTTISHPKAANQTFLISDDEDISTTNLLRRIGECMEKPARLIPVSPKILSFLFKIIGRQDFGDRLLGSLEIDITKAKKLLAWSPPLTLNEGLRATVNS
jgi:nucleoside-diphosphate-sugar epimerase